MKGKPNRRQHYLPQCYLRNFSENGQFVWTYNKHRSKKYRQSLGKAGQHEDFYKIPEKYNAGHEDNLDPNFIETDFFANYIEGPYDVLLKTINKDAEEWLIHRHENNVLSQADKELFAAHIAIQFLRMPYIRDKYWDFLEKSSAKRLDVIKAFAIAEFPEHKNSIEGMSIEYDEAGKSIIHADFFADQEIVNDYQDAILDKHWIFYVTTDKSIYTSDTPILRKPHLNKTPFLMEGFAMPGVEIIFPLGSSVMLTMWDKHHFDVEPGAENKFHLISRKELQQYNLHQYCQSSGEVYSRSDNFHLIESVVAMNDGKEVSTRKSYIHVY
jgi:hypothetical protein